MFRWTSLQGSLMPIMSCERDPFAGKTQNPDVEPQGKDKYSHGSLVGKAKLPT